jgi:hypothetical protein
MLDQEREEVECLWGQRLRLPVSKKGAFGSIEGEWAELKHGHGWTSQQSFEKTLKLIEL